MYCSGTGVYFSSLFSASLPPGDAVQTLGLEFFDLEHLHRDAAGALPSAPPSPPSAATGVAFAGGRLVTAATAADLEEDEHG